MAFSEACIRGSKATTLGKKVGSRLSRGTELFGYVPTERRGPGSIAYWDGKENCPRFVPPDAN